MNIVDLNEKIVSNIRDWGKNDLVFDKLSVKPFSDGSFRTRYNPVVMGISQTNIALPRTMFSELL